MPYTEKSLITATLVLICYCCVSCNSADKSSDEAAPLFKNPYPGMVLVQAGAFVMGSEEPDAKPDTRPLHRVYLDAFYIDKYEITNRLYQRFVLETGHPPPHVDTQWAQPYNWKGTDYPPDSADCPVVLVSWHDASAFACWSGKRLPTEAEWEKAARGGKIGMRYPFGNSLAFRHANFDKGYLRTRKIYPVGSFAPNDFGLFDVSGNVWEWCQDLYSDTFYARSPPGNPSGPSRGFYRVLRGGSWINDKKYLTCAYRGKNVADYKDFAIGFRCALSADDAHPVTGTDNCSSAAARTHSASPQS